MPASPPSRFPSTTKGLLFEALGHSYYLQMFLLPWHVACLFQRHDQLFACYGEYLATLKAGVRHVVLTLGANGVALYHKTSNGAYQIHHMPALPANVQNTNGAGDCLVAGACMRLMQGSTPAAALAYGLVSPFPRNILVMQSL